MEIFQNREQNKWTWSSLFICKTGLGTILWIITFWSRRPLGQNQVNLHHGDFGDKVELERNGFHLVPSLDNNTSRKARRRYILLCIFLQFFRVKSTKSNLKHDIKPKQYVALSHYCVPKAIYKCVYLNFIVWHFCLIQFSNGSSFFLNFELDTKIYM